MTKNEYKRYIFIVSLLFGAFFALIIAAYVLDAFSISKNICYSLMFIGFGFGFATLAYLLVSYRRVYTYEKQAKEEKIDRTDCSVIENFNVVSLKALLREKGFEEKENCFYKKKYSLIKDTTKYFVKFYDSSDLEASLADGEKNLDTYVHFTYNICHILIISMNSVTDFDIKRLKDITKKHKVSEEMLTKAMHYNNLVCFLVDKSCGKAYYIDSGRAKLTTYAYGVRVIKDLYK